MKDINSPSEVRLFELAVIGMKNNKTTAEEQVTGKLGELCSGRKACRQK